MNLIKKIFILIFMVSSFPPFSAIADNKTLSDSDPKNFVVGLFFDENGDTYNPLVGYGSVLRYTLSDPNLSIQYTHHDDVENIPIAPLMQRAAVYWSRVTAPHFTVRERREGESANFILQTMLPVMLDSSNAGLYLGNLDAYTVFPHSREYEEDVRDYGITSAGIFFRPSIPITDDVFTNWEDAMGSGRSFREYAEHNTYALILHEMGHALGLAHPDEIVNGPSFVTDIHPRIYRTNSYDVYWLPDSHETPIMLQHLTDFLLTLRQRLGQDLTLDNIAVSEQEINVILSQLSFDCRPHRENFDISSRSLSLTKSKYCNHSTVYPLAKRIVPIITALSH
ncbi:hypothetical protein [Xenorhabdus sp. KK7.4]|uniref:hypothetical protein n=1 Tax=Xenorhabdus sp. KK7.4 TaxID=1851572 RepID=UPI000C050419|nr:hypothetical protein [Xenorhabdus sp. KK7.4]PHM59855.1 hypothetical protein Xekk_00293 [Xenorhabdus sp. KK7.4]